MPDWQPEPDDAGTAPPGAEIIAPDAIAPVAAQPAPTPSPAPAPAPVSRDASPGARYESPYNVDRRGAADVAAASARVAGYWEAESSSVMPTGAPLGARSSSAPAVDQRAPVDAGDRLAYEMSNAASAPNESSGFSPFEAAPFEPAPPPAPAPPSSIEPAPFAPFEPAPLIDASPPPFDAMPAPPFDPSAAPPFEPVPAPAFESAPPMLTPEAAGVTAVLVDEPEPLAPPVPSASAPVASPAPGGAVAEGGPQFGRSAAVAAPVGPPGTSTPYGAMPAMQPPGTFTPAPAPKPRGKTRKRLVMLLVLVILGGAAYVAYPRVQEKIQGDKTTAKVPPHLAAYVGGNGFTYAPARGGFAIRLPASPKVTSPPAGAGVLSVTQATSAGLGFAVTVTERVFAVAPPSPAPLVQQTLDSDLTTLGVPAKSQPTTFRGFPAAQAKANGANRPARFLAVLAGKHLFVFSAASTRGTDDLFAALTKSFRQTK